ncbi:HIR complex subunit [Coemansia sp. Cherry 401B]|nr:HIR complex subunit [Coemansia sp. Cherry 401B]
MRISKPAWLHHDADKKTATAIFSVDFHPDGQRLATGGMDGKVRLWRTDALRGGSDEPRLATLAAHTGAVLCVRFSHGRGQFLATGSDDMVVLVWELDRGADYAGLGAGSLGDAGSEVWRPTRRLTGHASDVCDMAWSPQNRYLATCGLDNRVLVWDARRGFARVATLDAHTGFVKGVTFDPAGKYLASQSDDKTLRIWRTSDWAPAATVDAPFADNIFSTYFRRPSWAPDGSCVAAANAANGRVPVAAVVRRAAGWPADTSFVGHHAAIECVRFSPRVFRVGDASACVCAAAGQDRGVSVWLTSQPVPLAAATGLFAGSVFDLAWHSPEPASCGAGDDAVVALLAACSFDGSVALLELTRAELGAPVPAAEQGAMLAAHGCTRAYAAAATLADLHELSDDDAAGSQGGHVIAETVEQVQLEGLKASAEQSKSIAEESKAEQPQAPAEAPEPIAEESKASAEEPKALTDTPMPVPVRTKDGRKRVAPVFVRPLGRTAQNSNSTSSAHSRSSAPAMTVSADPPRLPLDAPLWIEARVLATRQQIEDSKDPRQQTDDKDPPLLATVADAPALAQPIAAARMRLHVPRAVAQLASDGPHASVVAYNGARGVRLACAQPAGWTAHLPGACTCLAASAQVAAVALADRTLHWLDAQSGARLQPPLALDAPAVLLRCERAWCLALDAAGLLSVYDTQAARALIDHVSLAPLLAEPDTAVTGVMLTRRGGCVVQCSDGRAHAYHRGLRAWLRVADPHAHAASDFRVHASANAPVATAGDFAAFARTHAAGSQLEGIQESAALQRQRCGRGEPEDGSARVSAAARLAATVDHLEQQLLAAAAIDSADDVVRFADLLARRLAQLGDSRRAAHWLGALLGPALVPGLAPADDGDGWQPCLAGVPKRQLLRRMLGILATNRHLQALVSEYLGVLDGLVTA